MSLCVRRCGRVRVPGGISQDEGRPATAGLVRDGVRLGNRAEVKRAPPNSRLLLASPSLAALRASVSRSRRLLNNASGRALETPRFGKPAAIIIVTMLRPIIASVMRA